MQFFIVIILTVVIYRYISYENKIGSSHTGGFMDSTGYVFLLIPLAVYKTITNYVSFLFTSYYVLFSYIVISAC